MENKSNESLTQSNDDVIFENTPARLRRLKIQQGILLKSVRYFYSKFSNADSDLILIYYNPINTSNIDLKKYFDKINVTFIEIQNLYEEIRLATKADKINPSDIDAIKKDLMALEIKIKQFKDFIRSELDILRIEEQSLKAHQKISKKYFFFNQTQNNITTPSPVKVLIDSPFKYPEVQQFQEFMKGSNRFGGWSEFNHNRFIQIWNGYNDNDALLKKKSGFDENSEFFQNLTEEVLYKISGVSKKDIISHCEWYLKYLRLYELQQNALNKWKENRTKIKKQNKVHVPNQQSVKISAPMKTKRESLKNKLRPTEHSDGNISTEIENLFERNVIGNQKESDSKGEEKTKTDKKTYQSSLMKPTKQWIYRCSDKNETERTTCDVDKLKRLYV